MKTAWMEVVVVWCDLYVGVMCTGHAVCLDLGLESDFMQHTWNVVQVVQAYKYSVHSVLVNEWAK